MTTGATRTASPVSHTTTPPSGQAVREPDHQLWAELVSRLWNRQPGKTAMDGRTADALTVPGAYAAVATASGPFRSGTRVRAAPDVRFHAPGGLLRAPADRLPGPEDRTLADYQERLRSRDDLPRWLLSVDHPLLVDFALWTRVRDLLSDLWRQVGWPVVPVKAELALGHRYRRPTDANLRPGCAGLLLVLTGTASVRLWRQRPEDASGSGPAGRTSPAPAPSNSAPPDSAPSDDTSPGSAPPPHGPAGVGPDSRPPDQELRASAGEVLYWPTGYWSREEFGDDCLLLRLEMHGEHRAALAVVKNVLTDTAQATAGYHDATVPYLPLPQPAAADGAMPGAPPVAESGDLFSALVSGPDLERHVRLAWAARRSAAGLEPVPPARAQDEVLSGRRIRVTSEIVRVPDGPDGTLWAVNGHLLPVSGAASETIRQALPAGREVAVAEVCAAVGAPDGHPAVMGLLNRLYRLRGVEAADAAEAPVTAVSGQGARSTERTERTERTGNTRSVDAAEAGRTVEEAGS